MSEHLEGCQCSTCGPLVAQVVESVDVKSILSVVDMKKPKAEPWTLSEMEMEIDRLIHRAKFYSEPITIKAMEEIADGLQNIQEDDSGASEVLSHITDALRDFNYSAVRRSRRFKFQSL